MSFLDRIAAAVTPAASDEKRAEARRRVEELAASEPWLAMIVDQHKQIESLVSEGLSAGSRDARLRSVKQLATVLTAHANAEETVIYPDVAEFSGKTHAGMAYEEHAMTKVNLAKLEKMDPAHDEWREKLSHIQGALQQHIYQEEDSWLPDLVENLPAEEKERMTRRFVEEHERYGDDAPMQRTQAMPHDGRKGAADGVNTQGRPEATGGSDAGAPYPNPHTGKSEEERENIGDGVMAHGGQSEIGYHGSRQLGSKEVEPGGNPNSGARGG